jgi:hypothetical protein
MFDGVLPETNCDLENLIRLRATGIRSPARAHHKGVPGQPAWRSALPAMGPAPASTSGAMWSAPSPRRDLPPTPASATAPSRFVTVTSEAAQSSLPPVTVTPRLPWPGFLLDIDPVSCPPSPAPRWDQPPNPAGAGGTCHRWPSSQPGTSIPTAAGEFAVPGRTTCYAISCYGIWNPRQWWTCWWLLDHSKHRTSTRCRNRSNADGAGAT